MPSLPPHLPLLAALADELARSGVRHAVLCPGSRNAPALLALDADPRITCWSVVDERSAAFLALGIAKATGMPAVVCVTSGTAISNLLPAVTEAHEAGTPLLLLTADRPPELRDVGAGQTIDQLRALDHVCRWVIEADLSEATTAREQWVRSTTCRAVAASLGPGRPGPVQINLPLREPLTAPGLHAPLIDGRAGGAPWLSVDDGSGIDPQSVASFAARCMAAARGIIVAGRAERSPELTALLPRLASILQWPLVADPMSGARRGPMAIAGYDLFAGSEAGQALAPDLVLRVGDLPVSKPLRAWLATTAAAAPQVMLTPEAIWADPDAAASQWLQGDPARIVRALITAVSAAREGIGADERAGVSEAGWTGRWAAADAAAFEDDRGRAVREAGPDAALTEPLVAQILATAAPSDATLVVGASLPIRMLERWAPANSNPPRVLSNRGANGIDGVISTAFGVAATAPPGAPVIAYVGDLTLLYDQGGLAGSSRLGLPLQIVVVNNDGGRIFDRLQVAKDAGPTYEERIATPHGLDLAHLAALHRLEHHTPRTVAELQSLLALPPTVARLIEVRVGNAPG